MKACKDFFFPPLFLFVGLLPTFCFSNPEGLEIISGDVNINEAQSGVLVIEASNRSIINYDSFSIEIGEEVQFIQPDASSTILNKVVGSDPSFILGKMQSNGRVFIVNQNGVYFGSSAQVDMGSLIVSSLDIASSDFVQDKFIFNAESEVGEVANLGEINAEGDVVLLSSRIKNEGLIIAKTGKVVLAAGEKVSLDFTGDGLVSFAIEGSLEEGHLLQKGTLKALKGEVVLSLGDMQRVIEETINTDGISFGEEFVESEGGIFLVEGSAIEAKSVRLSGKSASLLFIEGEIIAQTEVHIEAEQVHMSRDAKIYATEKQISKVALFAGEALSFSGMIVADEGTVEVGGSKLVQINSSNVEAADWKLRGDIALGCDIKTAGGNVTFKGPLELQGFINMETSGGTIIFEQTVDKGGLFLKTGSGEARFSKAIGSYTPLSSFKIEESEKLALGNNLYTAGGEIHFGSPLLLLGDIKVDTTGGGLSNSGSNISLLQGAFGNHRLNLNAGSLGVLDIAEGAGNGSSALSAILMQASSIRLKGNMRADGGTIIFGGPVILTEAITIEDTGPTGILFFGPIDSELTPVSLTLRAPIGKIGFYGEVGSSVVINDLTASSSEIQIGKSISLFGDLTLDGPVTLTGDVEISSTGILISETIDGPFDCSCNAGILGSIIIGNRAGGTSRLGDFTIKAANMVRTKAIHAKSITQEYGTGTTTFDGPMTTLGSDGIDLTGFQFVFTSAVETLNSGTFSIDHAGDVIIQARLNLTGPFIETGTGDLHLSRGITTNNNNITFNSPVVLDDSVYITTGTDGVGSITFLDVVDGLFSMTLEAGIGDIRFEKRIGATSVVKDIFISSAKNVTVEEDILAESFYQLDGTGTATYNGNITTTGVMGIYLFSHYLDMTGEIGGQLLRTVGNGNIILNSYFKDIGSVISPVRVEVLAGKGTVFEGSSHNVYLASGIGDIAGICTVRANPGSPVYYKEGLAAYEDVTPNICCSKEPIPPPPPPPPTPSAEEEADLYYIPGVYTNYWQFKDTLGAPWYFKEGFRNYKAYFVSKIAGLFFYQESEAYLFAKRQGEKTSPVTKAIFFFVLPFLVFFSAFKISQKGSRRKYWMKSICANFKRHFLKMLEGSLLQ